MYDDLEGLAGRQSQASHEPETMGLGIVKGDEIALIRRQYRPALLTKSSELFAFVDLRLLLERIRHPIGIQRREETGEKQPYRPERSGQAPHADTGGTSSGEFLIPIHRRQDKDDRNQQRNWKEHRRERHQGKPEISRDGRKRRPPREEIRYPVITLGEHQQTAKAQKAQSEYLGPFLKYVAIEDTHCPE